MRLPFLTLLIGGQAVLLHARPRATEDIDITLGMDNSHLPRLLQLTRDLKLEVLTDDAVTFVNQTNVLPTRDPKTGIRIDFIFSFTPYEQQAIAHAVHHKVGGHPLRFATAEDLILHKLFASRPRDIEDIRSVLSRKGMEIDRVYLQKWAKEFSTLEEKNISRRN